MHRRVVALAGIAVAALAAPLVVLGQTGALEPLTTILNRPWPAPVVAEDESKPAPDNRAGSRRRRDRRRERLTRRPTPRGWSADGQNDESRPPPKG